MYLMQSIKCMANRHCSMKRDTASDEPVTIAWTDGQNIHAVDSESELPDDIQTESESDDSFSLDDEKIEQAKEDVDYVNQMLNGEF